MAQTGYTPILIYSSSTASAAPAANSLTNSTLGSELAINITDGKLFYKDNSNAIQVIGWKIVPTTAGGTGLTSYVQGDLLYYNSGTTLTALAKSTTATRYLSNTGTNNNPAWAQVDLTNGVTGDLPYSNLAQGSALSVLGVTGNATADVASIAAGTDHQVLRRSGTSLAFGSIALNQSAAVSGTLPTGNGGTNLTSFTANGVVYASSTSALATGSAFTFDGTNVSTTGNFIVSTAGKGIDFSANSHAAGMTSELLTRYEEGTWTATLATGFTTTPTTTGYYTRIGRQVTITLVASFGVIVNNGAAITITGVPFSAANPVDAVMSGQRIAFNSANAPFIQLSGTTISFYEVVPSSPTVNSLTSSSGAGNAPVLGYISITYFV